MQSSTAKYLANENRDKRYDEVILANERTLAAAKEAEAASLKLVSDLWAQLKGLKNAK